METYVMFTHDVFELIFAVLTKNETFVATMRC